MTLEVGKAAREVAKAEARSGCPFVTQSLKHSQRERRLPDVGISGYYQGAPGLAYGSHQSSETGPLIWALQFKRL
jgi:hypothetical protein